MPTHPFPPFVPTNAKKLIIGTLPPENIPYYYSNSPNTRMWDLLLSIGSDAPIVGKGGYSFSTETKQQLLTDLNLGMTDIILEYNRSAPNSTSDNHITPLRYNDLVKLAIDHDIDEFIFVYQSALKWFLHSQKDEMPVSLTRLKGKYEIGHQPDIAIDGRQIKCTLLPSPLSRGTKGMTLIKKLELYKHHINA